LLHDQVFACLSLLIWKRQKNQLDSSTLNK
jgi:hypothetical protein